MVNRFDYKETSVNKSKRSSQRFGVALLTVIALIVIISPLSLLISADKNAMLLLFAAMFLSFVTTPVGIIIALIGCIWGINSLQNKENEGFTMRFLVFVNICIILAGLYYGVIWLSNM